MDKEVCCRCVLNHKSQLTTSQGSTYFSIRKVLEGRLLFQEKKDIAFPIPLQFILEEASASITENLAKSEHYNLNHPGNFFEWGQMRAFKDKPIPFLVIDKPPYLDYPKAFLDRYGDLKLFRDQLLASYFGQELYTLFEIARHDLMPFVLQEEKPWPMKKTFLIKEMNPDQVIIEVITLLDPKKDPEQQLVHYHTRALWTIDRHNSLQFTVEEMGSFTLAMCLKGEDVTITHTIEKKIETKTCR
jgi:hypothetical protein